MDIKKKDRNKDFVKSDHKIDISWMIIVRKWMLFSALGRFSDKTA